LAIFRLDYPAKWANLLALGNQHDSIKQNIEGKKMPQFTLYRADGRSFEKMRSDFSEGFKAWTPMTITQARQFANCFLGTGINTVGLPAQTKKAVDAMVTKNFRGQTVNPKLNSLSQYIKYTKDKSTVWTSWAVNEDCGGQGGGGTIYKITLDLNEYLVGSTGVLAQGSRTQAKVPSILLDNTSIGNSTIIALNHGPIDDAEVSFFTTVALNGMTTV
jgi:insecticidal toxin complex protein TccC